MRIWIYILFMIMFFESRWIWGIIEYLLQWVKKDSGASALCFDDMSQRGAFILRVICATVIYGLIEVILYYNPEMIYKAVVGISLIGHIAVRLIQAIKDKEYRNIEYNKALNSIGRVECLIESLKDSVEQLSSISNNKNRIHRLKSMIVVLNEIRSTLIYNNSLADLGTVTGVSQQLGGNNDKCVRELVTEMDKLNALAELSNNQLNSMYKALMMEAVEIKS